MPLHHCRGSNYLQFSSFWSTVKIRRFSWLHSSAGNSGGISLLLFFLFRGKMRSLRVPHPFITTALFPYYPNPDLLQTPAKVSQAVGQRDGCTHTQNLLWKLPFCWSGISTFWVDNKVINTQYVNYFCSQTEKELLIMSSSKSSLWLMYTFIDSFYLFIYLAAAAAAASLYIILIFWLNLVVFFLTRFLCLRCFKKCLLLLNVS